MLDRIIERAAEGRTEANDGKDFAWAMVLCFVLGIMILGML